MAGPWEDFQPATKAAPEGPWSDFQQAQQPSGYIDNVRQGAGEFAEGVGNTLNKMGFTNAGPALQQYGKSVEPANFVPTPIFNKDGSFNGWSGIGKTLARGAVPGAASIMGAGLAAPLGPMAAIAGGALPGILSDTGNEIDNTGSVPRGIATSVAENAVSALPVSKFLGGAAPAAEKVGMAGAKAAFGRLANTAVSQGLASAGGAATGDLLRNGDVQASDVLNAGVGGAAGATLFAGARKTVPEVLDALHYSSGGNAPEDVAARQMAANRVLQAAGTDNLQGRLLGNGQIQRNGAAAVNIARLGINNELSDAVSDFNSRGALPNDAKTVLAAAMSGNLPNGRGYQTLQAGLGNDPQATNILNLVRQQQQLNLVGGHTVGDKLTGGAGGLMHSFLTPEHILKTGLVGLIGAGEEGAGHVIAFSPTTLGAAAGGGAVLRMLDNLTGAQAPAGRFVRNFANPGGPTNLPPVVQPQAQAAAPAPAPAVPPTAPVAPAAPTINPLALPKTITTPAKALSKAMAWQQKLQAQAAKQAAKVQAVQRGVNPKALALDAANATAGGDNSDQQDDENKLPFLPQAAIAKANGAAPAAPAPAAQADDLTIPPFLQRAPLNIAKVNGTTQVNGEEYAPSSYAHLPVDQAADAILKDAQIGKNVKFAGNYRSGIVTRITKERQAMANIAAEVPGLPIADLTARLEGRSSQSGAKAYREQIRQQYPQASAALDRHLSDAAIKEFWRKKG